MLLNSPHLYQAAGCAFLIALLCTGCGAAGAARESWTLIQILTTGERTETRIEQVAVRNCGVPEVKTVECSAGTADSFSVELGGSVGVNAGGTIEFAPSLATELGFDLASVETLALPTPPEGYVAYYTIEKTYRLMAGQVLARSSHGDEESMQYAFQASCSQHVADMSLVSCENAIVLTAPPTTAPVNTPSPDTPPLPVPAHTSTPTHTPTPYKTMPPPNNTATSTPTATGSPAIEPPKATPINNDGNVIVTPSAP